MLNSELLNLKKANDSPGSWQSNFDALETVGQMFEIQSPWVELLSKAMRFCDLNETW